MSEDIISVEELNENSAEDEAVVAQRFLNIFRQLHVLSPEKKEAFDNMILAQAPEVRGAFSKLLGGNNLQEYVNDLEKSKGLKQSYTDKKPSSNKAKFSSSDYVSVSSSKSSSLDSDQLKEIIEYISNNQTELISNLTKIQTEQLEHIISHSLNESYKNSIESIVDILKEQRPELSNIDITKIPKKSHNNIPEEAFVKSAGIQDAKSEIPINNNHQKNREKERDFSANIVQSKEALSKSVAPKAEEGAKKTIKYDVNKDFMDLDFESLSAPLDLGNIGNLDNKNKNKHNKNNKNKKNDDDWLLDDDVPNLSELISKDEKTIPEKKVIVEEKIEDEAEEWDWEYEETEAETETESETETEAETAELESKDDAEDWDWEYEEDDDAEEVAEVEVESKKETPPIIKVEDIITEANGEDDSEDWEWEYEEDDVESEEEGIVFEYPIFEPDGEDSKKPIPLTSEDVLSKESNIRFDTQKDSKPDFYFGKENYSTSNERDSESNERDSDAEDETNDIELENDFSYSELDFDFKDFNDNKVVSSSKPQNKKFFDDLEKIDESLVIPSSSVELLKMHKHKKDLKNNLEGFDIKLTTTLEEGEDDLYK